MRTHIGIDGCRAGWFFVSIGVDDRFDVGLRRAFSELAPLFDATALVLVDIPIGLPSERVPRRLVDEAARRLITPRGASVFPVPARSALAMPTYEAASAENERCLGRRLSRQTWNICPKIREVDDFLAGRSVTASIREMHPEVAFWALNGRSVLTSRKRSASGFRERLELLSRHYSHSEAVVEAARGRYPRKKVLADDDILDAMVGAVTARCEPQLETVPAWPLRDDRGLPMEMVYAAPGDDAGRPDSSSAE